MSYEIIRTTQFRKDVKRMVSRGKDDKKLEEVLRTRNGTGKSRTGAVIGCIWKSSAL